MTGEEFREYVGGISRGGGGLSN